MNFLKFFPRCIVAVGIMSGSMFAGEALSLNGTPAATLVDIRDRPVPKVQNGFVVSFNPLIADVWLFDESGNRVNNVRLSIPNASLVRVTDAAASPDGRIAILSSAATAEGQLAPFIAWMDSSGRLDKVVRTTPFVAHRIVFAKDGTLWAVGHLYNDQHSTDVPKHDVVWQFGSDGRMLRSLLPSNSFSHPFPSATSWLTASANTIAVYFERTSELVEIDSTSGKLLGRWTVPVPARSAGEIAGSVGGIALTSSGDVVMVISSEDEKRVARPGFFRFDRQSGTLIPLDTSKVAAYTMLLGADGDRLVLMGQDNGIFKFALADMK